MIGLAFDASAKSASVAVFEEEKLLCSKSIENGNTHSEELMALMDEVLKEAGTEVSELGAIYVANGPGSFTGIRIALSLAKGLAHALQIPVYPVSTLEGLSYHGATHRGLICPIMDARRSRVYCALYRSFGGERLMEASALRFEELVEILGTYGEEILFVGDAILPYAKEIELIRETGDLKVAPLKESHKLANAEGIYLAAKAYQIPQQSYGDVLPIYLRKPQAEREKDARKACNSKTCTD